jgi:hypothetical protein
MLVVRPDLATEYQAATDELVVRLGTREPSWSRVARCARLRFDGDSAAAERCYVDNLAKATAEANPIIRIGSLRPLVEMWLEEGRFVEAKSHAEQALEVSQRIGERWSRTELTSALAVALAGTGDIARADRTLEEARSLTRGYDTYAVAYVAYCAARIADIEGRTVEAEAEFRKALDVFERTEFVYRHATLRLEYAEFLARRGRAAEAARELLLVEQALGSQTGARLERIDALRQVLRAHR